MESSEPSRLERLAGPAPRAGPARVSVVTPWLDRPEFIDDYEAAVGFEGAEVIIVDNGSSAENAARLEAMASRLGGRYLRNASNRWFSAACNQGLAAATGEVVVFLNNDVAGPAGALAVAATQVKAGALFGPSLVRATVAGRPIEFLEGWCVAARSDVWRRLGGWDERAYPLPYWEDADLCLRALRAGLRLVRAEWPVTHKGRGTSAVVPGAFASFQANLQTLAGRLGATRGGVADGTDVTKAAGDRPAPVGPSSHRPAGTGAPPSPSAAAFASVLARRRLAGSAGGGRRRGSEGIGVAVGETARPWCEDLRRRWRGSCEVIPGDDPAAAGRFADGSLAFVYLDAGPAHAPNLAAMAAWWAKVAPGGVLGGPNYLDGAFRGARYAVRSAADEFAASHGLSLRLTLDQPPQWLALKGERPPDVGSLKIGLLTAHDVAQAPLAAVSSPNKSAYCRRHGYEFIEKSQGFDPRRHPAWGKVKFLRELLPRFDWLFWSDADSLILRPEVPLESFLPGDGEAGDLVICLEDMGVGVFHVNSGQFFLRNTPWSLKFLDDWYAVRDFEQDALREQRALIHLIESRDLSRRVRLVPQRRFNSYPCNYRPGDFLLHFPDLPMPQRLRLMRQFSA